MPLNKLENFIKNTDGRTLYVNPADLNATDSIDNQGTSLTEPFRTIQRALLESARFSYVRGNDNDLIEKTTILVYPGDYTIDNRPGFGIRLNQSGDAVAVSPSGNEVAPESVFNLTSDTNFDIESSNNILWHFNSIYGGCIVPRGTSIVGMDLRKTKIRPKYVPNPTDPTVGESAIFRITGTCYFWQFTIFDGPESGFVFTDPRDFSENNQSTPTFSHNKLTAFEYADGVNRLEGFSELTDLQMYYSKLSNAFNEASGRPIDEKYPIDPEGFAPQRPEFEIVGAFATDPVRIANLQSGDGFSPDAVVTVDTVEEHGLSEGTPIKIRDVSVSDYNISTKVTSIISPTTFTYNLSFVRPNLPARPSVSSATVTIETDTVTGASPYIFNVSMRSVWGINGMHADGSKATGFRSMVVAQFTAISLQKDDRAFVSYNEQSRRYDGIDVSQAVRGAELAAQSSSTNSSRVYHLDPNAIYRPGWDTTHIKMSNDAVVQIVSVFAIGFNQHFAALSGADASITNSNSNFGQFALLSDGFKNEAFDKDDQGFISQVITPNNAFNPSEDDIDVVDWVNIDFELTNSQALPGQLYLQGFTNKESRPPTKIQGYSVGANYNEVLTQRTESDGDLTFSVRMVNNVIDETTNVAEGQLLARKVYPVQSGPGQGPTSGSTLTLPTHKLINGESIRIFSSDADLPENIEEGQLYYANVVDSKNIRISTSEANALNNIFVEIFGGTSLRIESRVNDKEAGEFGHPVQYDEIVGNWFVHTDNGSPLYDYIRDNPTSNAGIDFITTFERKPDNRSLDDKIYRLRYVIPRATQNSKPPTPGYTIQYSSSTGARNNDDFLITDLTEEDYNYRRNPSYIVDCVYSPGSGPDGGNEVRTRTELPHRLSIGDKVKVLNVTSTNNSDAVFNRGFNGEFFVTRIDSSREFRYSSGTRNLTGETFTNDTNIRNLLLPRFERKDDQVNVFVYRVETIVDFVEGVRDGIYHLFCINSSNAVNETFTEKQYNQPIEDYYPQIDFDNVNDNPLPSVSFANRAPLGKVTIDEKQNSLTRETIDKVFRSRNINVVESVTVGSNNNRITFDRAHNFGGVYGYVNLQQGSGYTNGTYYNIKLLSAGSVWKGASAKVLITSGRVNSLTITDPGSGYEDREILTVDPTELGGGSNASIEIRDDFIEGGVDTVVQVCGGGSSVEDFYAPITAVNNESLISISNRSVPGTGIVPGMYVLPVDTGAPVTTYTYDPETGISRFERGIVSSQRRGYGLQRGNSFVVFSTQNDFLGKFYVSDVEKVDTITAKTDFDLGNVGLIAKAGLEDNDASTGQSGENIGIRGSAIFDNGEAYVASDSSGTGPIITVTTLPTQQAQGISERFYLGRYVQIGSEILRVASTTFGGSNANEVTFIRGALGTQVINHPARSKIRCISPLSIELRRPSILRASGHTFEYLGYGPGNYSTALPQLQVRQLPDEEVFLVQAQEQSCGQVVYTGMSDNGDFYIGNTKYSATSGTQTTFDVPRPTVAGQKGTSNNIVFDEVVINRRLFVAGGENGEVLSQFDGPVKFTESVDLKNSLTVSGRSTLGGRVTISNERNSSSSTSSAALKVSGGVSVAKDLFVGGSLSASNVTISGGTNFDEIETNKIEPRDVNLDVDFYTTLSDGFTINIGSAGNNTTAAFKNDTDASDNDPSTATAPVEIDGGLVVRKTIVADTIVASQFSGGGVSGGPGTIIMWGGESTTIPDGYLLCDGSPLAVQGIYNDLFQAIRYTHGGGGASFRLPDLRDRFIVGSGSTYEVADKGGSDTVELTVDELATHTHTINDTNLQHDHASGTYGTGNPSVTTAPLSGTVSGGTHGHTGGTNSAGNHSHSITDPGHSHEYTESRNETQAGSGDDGGALNSENTGISTTGITINSNGLHDHTVTIPNDGTQGDHSHTLDSNSSANISHTHGVNGRSGNALGNHSHSADNTGSGLGHENRPPYYSLCYIIQFK